MSARRSAVATASVRDSADSFTIACRTWDWTVSGEMPSAAATRSFVSPSAMRPSTSCSRGVSGAVSAGTEASMPGSM